MDDDASLSYRAKESTESNWPERFMSCFVDAFMAADENEVAKYPFRYAFTLSPLPPSFIKIAVMTRLRRRKKKLIWIVERTFSR